MFAYDQSQQILQKVNETTMTVVSGMKITSIWIRDSFLQDSRTSVVYWFSAKNEYELKTTLMDQGSKKDAEMRPISQE